MVTPDLAEPYNPLGLLSASSVHFSEAERLYREAIAKNPDLLAARHAWPCCWQASHSALPRPAI
jgi:hypothetical protein